MILNVAFYLIGEKKPGRISRIKGIKFNHSFTFTFFEDTLFPVTSKKRKFTQRKGAFSLDI